MQTIPKLLAIKNHEYNDMYFDAYLRWCESVSINENQVQSVLANASVNKYYNTEFAKCENEFLQLAKNYPHATAIDLQELYAKCMYAMFNKRCNVLLHQAKTLNLQGYDTAKQN